ncbi:MAG: serine hydrolase [Candidatus Saccharimonadales bacterium]
MSNQEPFSTAGFARLEDGLHRVSQYATNHGARFRFDVQNDRDIAHEKDVPMFAASLSKLPLAAVVSIERPKGNKEHVTIFSNDVKLDEAGQFDHVNPGEGPIQYPIEQSVNDVMIAMLGRSSNAAFRVLTKNRAPELQDAYARHGWHNTTLIPKEDGKVEIGTTTPEEALAQLQLLSILGSTKANRTARAAVEGLHTVTDTTHGLGVYDLTDADVLRKLGRYNGDPDDPYVYRHEVARVVTDEGAIDYAFMVQSERYSSKTSSLWQRRIANRILAKASGEVASYVGLERPRLLGLRALTS